MKRVSFIPLFLFIICFLIFPFKLIQTISIFVILFYLISFVSSKLMFYSVEVTRNKNLYYFRNGSSETVDLTIKNRGFILIENLFIKDMGAGCFENGSDIFIESVELRSNKNLEINIDTNKRGRYRVGPVIVKGSDPFNLFPWSKKVESYADIYIYPALLSPDLLLNEGDRGGVQKSYDSKYEDQLQLESMRDYRLGDELKKINWRTSARMGKLQSMEFSNTLSSPLFILLDVNPDNYPMRNRYSNIERAISVAASLLVSYSEKGEGVGIYLNYLSSGTLMPISLGYANTILALEKLSEIDFSCFNNESLINSFTKSGTKIPGGSHLYVIVPGVTDNLNRELELLKKRNCKIHIVSSGGALDEIIPPRFCNFLTMKSYGEELYI